MKCSIEIGSGVVIYTPCCIEISFGVQKLMGVGELQTHNMEIAKAYFLFL
jgi:hypothetical protein